MPALLRVRLPAIRIVFPEAGVSFTPSTTTLLKSVLPEMVEVTASKVIVLLPALKVPVLVQVPSSIVSVGVPVVAFRTPPD